MPVWTWGGTRRDCPCTIVVGTYGDDEWIRLANQRAIPSARAQGCRVVHVHADALHEARNTGLEQVTTEWVVFLDADDELRPDYVDTLLAGTADLRVGAIQYMTPGGRPQRPYVPKVAGHRHECTAECITSGAGNWIHIGAMVRAELVREAGGWRDWECYEDFCLWMRVLLLGATVEAIPEAVYVAWVRKSSRNRAPAMADKNRVHHAIVAANLGEREAA